MHISHDTAYSITDQDAHTEILLSRDVVWGFDLSDLLRSQGLSRPPAEFVLKKLRE